MEHVCRVCGSSGPFNPSYLARQNYLCKSCASKSVKECRGRDPLRLLAYRFYNSHRNEKLPQDLVTNVLKIWESKSVLSGEADLAKLCIVRYFKDLPISEWNSVVLTQREARRFSHLKSKVYDNFPQEVRTKLEMAREQNIK